jgi:hypothetical protein
MPAVQEAPGSIPAEIHWSLMLYAEDVGDPGEFLYVVIFRRKNC